MSDRESCAECLGLRPDCPFCEGRGFVPADMFDLTTRIRVADALGYQFIGWTLLAIERRNGPTTREHARVQSVTYDNWTGLWGVEITDHDRENLQIVRVVADDVLVLDPNPRRADPQFRRMEEAAAQDEIGQRIADRERP